MAIKLQILGPLRVTDGDEREVVLGGAKPAAVLAMLSLRPNEVVSSDRLIEDLWEGEPPPTAPKTLQVHISRLRRALGQGDNGDAAGPVVTTRGGYLLDVDPRQVDALRFEQLVAEGTAALADGSHAGASTRLRAALALWRGPALADFAYASFAQDTIARLDGLRTVALETAVEAELALGRHAELIPELKSLVKRHPLSEHLRAQLMLALYRSGRQAEALGVYRAARRVLVDQLGIEPSEELRDLERAILAQDKDLAAPTSQPRPRRRTEKSPRGALVGYEHELGALEDLLEQALTGQGRVALISGEPGVGKTRLADELSGVAHTRGAQVVWGRCWSGGGAPAHWPWIQVLRAIVAERDAMTLRAELGASAAELTQLLPELSEMLPDLQSPERTHPEEARFRMFDAAAKFVSRAAAARPLVIVLDDLHSADPATLALLQFMATAALDAPVLIVGTYRDSEAALERTLSDTLSDLARTSDCLQLVLTGLSGEDTAHFVELTAGVAPMPALAAAIHDASSGNPLFVTELVRLLRTEDRLHELNHGDNLVLPRGVDQVIARRLERLSDRCRETLALAAVIGRDFEMTLLAAAADAAADDVVAHVDDAVSARVVESLPASGFRFSHDLVRQALYASVAPVERRRLHGAVANALERLHRARPAPVAADLAHHFEEALPVADATKAVRYLSLAGDQAADVIAYDEAASRYARAVDIATTNGVDADVLSEIYVKLAEQLLAIPKMQRAREAIEEADALSADAPNPAREARLAVARAQLVMLDDSVVDEAAIFNAINLFEELGDHVGAARAWYALVVLNCGQSDRLQGGEAAERMLECAKRGDSKAMIAQALGSLASNLALGGAPTLEAITRSRALLAEASDGLIRGKIMCSIAKLEAKRGRFDEARALLADARAVVPPRQWETLAGFFWSGSAQIELLAGNPVRAEEHARNSCEDLESQGLARYLSSELMFLVDALVLQGRFDEASVHLERAVPFAADDDVDALFRQARSRARLQLAQGNVEVAETSIRTAVDYVERGEAPDEHAETLLVLAEVLRARDDEDAARAAAAEALTISTASENVVLAQQARDVLAAAAPVAGV